MPTTYHSLMYFTYTEQLCILPKVLGYRGRQVSLYVFKQQIVRMYNMHTTHIYVQSISSKELLTIILVITTYIHQSIYIQCAHSDCVEGIASQPLASDAISSHTHARPLPKQSIWYGAKPLRHSLSTYSVKIRKRPHVNSAQCMQ